jgi:hypothetical protein
MIRQKIHLAEHQSKNMQVGRAWWLLPGILATQELEIRGIQVRPVWAKKEKKKVARSHLNQIS